MSVNGIEPYKINNEYNITEILSHFDSDYIFDIIQDKLENIDYSSSLVESNIVLSFEENFKMMRATYQGDSQNINNIREQVYRQIIQILTERFNLEFNMVDDTIDVYTAAYYLYDFLVSNRNNIMVNFFTAFIVNNKNSLCALISTEDFRKNKDSAAAYGKRVYEDHKYAIISANMPFIINHISTLDITLLNIFQSTYVDERVVAFLDNAFADKGNFFKNHYCSILNRPDILPIIITNIRLALQKIVGSIAPTHLDELITANGGETNE
jgi:hypothetical protein